MQKTKKFRRLLAGGVAVLMLGVSVPVAAFATGAPETATLTEDGSNQAEKVHISYYDEEGLFIGAGPELDAEVGDIVTISDAALADTFPDIEAPYSWTVAEAGDRFADGTNIQVTLRKMVTLNVYYYAGENFVGNGEPVTVIAADYPDGKGTYDNTLLTDVPAGYTLVSPGAQSVDNYCMNVMVQLDTPEATTKEIGVNYYISAENRYVEGKVTVAADATNVKTSALTDIPEGYEPVTTGDITINDGWIYVELKKSEPATITMNVVFLCDGESVGGGDYFVPAGVQNYAVLEQYVPEGYKMTVSGDFYAEEGGKLTVNVEKIVKTVIMNIAFKDGDEVIAGGDYFLPEGVQNYSILEQYLPEGYKLTVSGDFMVKEGDHLDVNIEKISTDVIMNIQFKDGDEVIAGGDYTVPAGVQNYSVLEKYVPAGYQMTVSGDFMAEAGAHLEVNIEKIDTTVIMNIQFKYGDEVIAGGDYFVPAGVQNYSVLEQYVPEGYEMTVSGDFMAEEGAELVVNLEKVSESDEIIMNVQFMDGDVVVAGGDYFVPAGVQNYSVLEKYVPAGYKMTVSGDFMAEEGAKLEVNVEKISTDVIMNIRFVLGDG